MNFTRPSNADKAGIFWMTASMACFALEDVFIKQVTRELPIGQVLMLFGMGGAVVFALLAMRRGATLFTTQILTPLMLVRAICEFAGRLFYVLAVALTPISSATAILQSAPLWVALGALVFFKERFHWRAWVAIAFGLCGVLVILRPSAEDFSALSLLAVIGTMGFVGRDLATRATAMTVTTEALGFYGFSTMVLAGASFALWDGKAFVDLTLPHLWLLMAALVAGVLAYIALMTAMRTGALSAVTPFRYTRLLFGLALGVLVFHESPNMPMLVGCAMVIAAGLFLTWQGPKRPEKN